MKEEEINTLIFDFGGVIIDLHIDRTIEEFSALSGKSKEELTETYGLTDYFLDFEMGLISEHDFRNSLREDHSIDANDQAIDKAWNAMLGKIDIKRIEKLKSLAQTHELILLSNTNAIHVPVFTEILKTTTGVNTLNDLFHKVYYKYV